MVGSAREVGTAGFALVNGWQSWGCLAKWLARQVKLALWLAGSVYILISSLIFVCGIYHYDRCLPCGVAGGTQLIMKLSS